MRPVVLDMRALVDYTDYFLILSGESNVQVRAIADAVEEDLEKAGIAPWHVEGREDGRWVLLDYSDLVVHVFLEEAREFYDLERLWGDAPRVEI